MVMQRVPTISSIPSAGNQSNHSSGVSSSGVSSSGVSSSGASSSMSDARNDASALPLDANQAAESLRKSIENLINAKLQDMFVTPGGLDRLLAHRRTGVAGIDVRNAERALEGVIRQILPLNTSENRAPAKSRRRARVTSNMD